MSRRVVEIELLGGFSLSFESKTMASLPRTATSLLSYLVVHRSRAQTRDLLAGRFWSDLPDDKARKRLSNTLWQIRKALADTNLDGFIVTSSTTVQVSTDIDLAVDAERFERDLDGIEEIIRQGRTSGDAADQLSFILDQVPGELLEGFYDDWIDGERNRVNDRHEGGLQQLARLYKARSDYDSALRVLRHLLSNDQLVEENHREVMRTCALLGDGAAAERQYESCRKTLWNELKVEPSDETKHLIERIRSAAPSIVTPSTGEVGNDDLPMVGRSKERSALLSRADELHTGSGGLILIEGDAGIGKSRLVDDFVEGVEWRRLRVLRAGHTRLSPMRPYDGLREALGPATVGLRAEHLAETLDPIWIQQASSVLPELVNYRSGTKAASVLRPSEELSRMSEALTRVILAQGALGPTVIVLEDVHWCDQDSFEVLRNLGARLAQTAVLVVLTYRRFEAERSEYVWSNLAKLDTQPSSTRLMLQPLNVFELQDLVSGVHGPGAVTIAAAGQLLERTGGNPLFALESFRASPMLQLNQTSRGMGDESSKSGLDAGLSQTASFSERLPASLDAALSNRLDALDPVARRVIHTASAFSESFDASMVAEVTGLGRAVVLEALSTSVGAGFIADLNTGVCEFSHEHSRQSVYNGLTARERRQLHSDIYAWMEGAPDIRSEQLAFHACLSDRWDQGYSWHVEAADEALGMYAFRTAAENFAKAGIAAAEADFDLADTAPVFLRYEAALDVLGERGDQELLLKRLAGESLPLEIEVQLAERRCWYLANTDELGEAIRLALSWVERSVDFGIAPFSFLTIAGTALIWSGDAKGSIKPLTQVVEQCDVAGDLLVAETMLGRARIELLELETAADHIVNALVLARETGDVRGQVEALGHKALLDWHYGRYPSAEEIWLECLELSVSIGYRHGEGLNLVNLATLNGTAGKGGRALSYFSRATEVFNAHGNRRGEAIVQVNLAELYHLLLGDDKNATALANSAAVYFRSTNNSVSETIALSLMSSIDFRCGRSRRARQRLAKVLDRSTEAGDEISQMEARSVLASIEIGNDRFTEAIEHLDKVLAFAERHNVDTQVANALARKSAALVALGRKTEAVRCAKQAVELNVIGSRQPHVTMWLCGQTFEACGDDELASEQFEHGYVSLRVSLEGLSQELIDQSWSCVPDHKAIQAAYESRFQKLLEISLPRADAALGKALRPSDYVTIMWAVSEPDDWAKANVAERRRARVSRLAESAISQGGVARVSDLADVLGVSERTIKRDLVVLRGEGQEVLTRKSGSGAK